MKVLVTGVTGFAGTNLSRFLAGKGIRVDGCSRNEEAAKRVKGLTNLLTYDQLADINPAQYDAFIHLAGKAHDLKKVASDEEYFEVNFKLTQKLYDWYRVAPAGKFFFISSVKAVADQNVIDLDEKAKANPSTAYGRSKLEAEKYILSNPSCASYILRPCMIHGPGNKGNLNLLYQLVKKGIPWPLAAFDNKRSFLSVDNLSFIIWKMLTKEIASGVYHLADSEQLSTNQLIHIIASALDKKVSFIKVPERAVRISAKIGDALKLPLNSERLSKLTESYTVSNEKILSAINEALPVQAEEGLKQTIRSFEKIKK